MAANLEVVTKPFIVVSPKRNHARLAERLAGPFQGGIHELPQDRTSDVLNLGRRVQLASELMGAPVGLVAVGENAARTSATVREELPEIVDKVVLLSTREEAKLDVSQRTSSGILVFRPQFRAEDTPLLEGATYKMYVVDGPHGRISLEEEAAEGFKVGGGHNNGINLGEFMLGRPLSEMKSLNGRRG